jgi:hypothetical protein
MSNILEILDKTNRKIHLSRERWKHITTEHPEITNPQEIEQAISNPLKTLLSDRDSSVV